MGAAGCGHLRAMGAPATLGSTLTGAHPSTGRRRNPVCPPARPPHRSAMLQALKNSSLFVKLVIMVSLALCPPMLFSHLAESYFISKYGYEEAEKTVSNVARLSAESSTVIEGMRSDKPEARKQMIDFVEMLTHVSNVKFIVLIDMQGIRLYHPES